METRQLELVIEDNEIKLLNDKKQTIISKDASILGSMIFKALDYEIGNNYNLKELKYEKDSSDYKKLNPLWKMIKDLIGKINALNITSDLLDDEEIE